MKKSIYSKWHVKLSLAIVLVLAAYLTWESFMSGVREGRARAESKKSESQAVGK